MPVLDTALAWIACELRELVPGGDHEIGIGEVIGMGTGDDSDPLVWFARALHDDRRVIDLTDLSPTRAMSPLTMGRARNPSQGRA